jgi:hypothetical protein
MDRRIAVATITDPLLHRERCRICNAPVTIPDARLFSHTCPAWRCRSAHWIEVGRQRCEAKQREREAESQRRMQRADAERRRLAEELPIIAPETFLPVPLPAFQRPLAPLPPDRREAFRQHLRDIIRTAFETPAPDHADETEAGAAEGDAMLPILDTACALCQGRCCRDGENHAYLSADTILRYRARDPGATAEEVFQAYDGRVTDVVFADSCIYHQPQGCGLPPSMRSTTCNAFECEELAALHVRRAECEDGCGLFLVALDADRAVRWSLVTAPGSARPVDDDPRPLRSS